MKNISNKILTLALALTILITFSFSPVSANTTSQEGEKVLQIISFNDFHGSLKEGSKELGYAKFVAALNSEKESNPNTIVVSAGDNFQGSAMSNLTYGEPVNEMMNALDVVASAVGNHEFDWGVDQITKWQENANYTFLASNIYDKETNEPVAWAKPYKFVEVDGVKIALIGLSTLETAYKTKAENVKTLEFKDAAVAAQIWIDYLKSGKDENGVPDVIVALTHIGAKQDAYGSDLTKPVTGEEIENLCNNVTGLDAVVTGHSHSSVSGYINNIPVIQGYKNGRAYGKLTITMNADGTLEEIVPALNNAYKTKDDVTPDAAALKAYDKWNTELSPILDKVLGQASDTFTHSKLDNVSVLGRWVCETMAKKVNTQIAIQNGGGLRRDIPSGDITYGTLYEVMPFDNTLVTMDLLGSDILKNIEYGTDNTTVGNASYSGLIVAYDSSKEAGSKVTSISLSDGTPLEMNKYYSVVINDFMYPTGDNFDFTNAKNFVDTFVPIRDVLIDEIKASGTIVAKKADYVTKVIPLIKIEDIAKTTYDTYIVKDGDVLWKIAEQFKTTYNKLGDLNKLKNVNLIFQGQELLVPAK